MRTRNVAVHAHGEPPGTGEHHVECGPHEFDPLSRWTLRPRCRHCYAPKSLHPREGWVRARPLGDRRFIGASAPHFDEGW